MTLFLLLNRDTISLIRCEGEWYLSFVFDIMTAWELQYHYPAKSAAAARTEMLFFGLQDKRLNT